MGFFSKLFKGPEIDMEKSDANAKKMRALFHQAVGGGEDYRLIFGYTEDVKMCIRDRDLVAVRHRRGGHAVAVAGAAAAGPGDAPAAAAVAGHRGGGPVRLSDLGGSQWGGLVPVSYTHLDVYKRQLL